MNVYECLYMHVYTLQIYCLYIVKLRCTVLDLDSMPSFPASSTAVGRLNEVFEHTCTTYMFSAIKSEPSVVKIPWLACYLV